MRKILLIILVFLLMSPTFAFSFKKKEKPKLLITSCDPSVEQDIQPVDVFEVGQRIYFMIYIQEGFKSDYIKYQIVKQDDNAHMGGYTRMRNITRRVRNKNYYSDYFTLSQAGKYYLQVFDIQNLHQWLAIGAFRVVDK